MYEKFLHRFYENELNVRYVDLDESIRGNRRDEIAANYHHASRLICKMKALAFQFPNSISRYERVCQRQEELDKMTAPYIKIKNRATL
jgi:hypothetical protein